MPEFVIQEFDEAPSRIKPTHSNNSPHAAAAAPFCHEYVVVVVTSDEQQPPPSDTRRNGRCPALVVQQQFSGNSSNTDSSVSKTTWGQWLYWIARILRTAFHSLARFGFNLFLPVGYPDTVRSGYWDYQLYDSIQGLCSYLRGVVSSAHVLQAAGVGNEHATAWGAAVTWALRDGMGLLGGLAFSAAAAPLFDAHVKEFRFFADISNNVALTMDMLLPVLVMSSSASPSTFLYASAVSTLCKTMCGMSAGATKGSITQHFAVAGNLADLHAKEGTQETLMSLVGMTLGIGLARYFQQLEERAAAIAAKDGDTAAEMAVFRMQWIIFGALTLLHTLANFRAVQLLRLRTLNRQRALDVLQKIVQEISQFLQQNGNDATMLPIDKLLDTIPAPEDIHESLAASTYDMLLPERWSRIVLGAPLVSLVTACTDSSDTSSLPLQSIWDEFAHESYVLAVSSTGRVWVSLLTQADSGTELQAFVHALLVQECWRIGMTDDRQRLVQKTHAAVRELFAGGTADPTKPPPVASSGHTTISAASNNLWSHLQARGWELQHHRLYLGFSRRRSRWSASKTD